jgi:hypothetical protein
MSFLSHIAMRALGDAGNAPAIMPKGHGIAMRAAAPEADLPQDEAAAPVARSVVHRDPRDPVPEPEAPPREDDMTGPVQPARRAEAEPRPEAEETGAPEQASAVGRAVHRAAAAPDEGQPDGLEVPAARALAPETDEPPVPQDEPPETRNEKVPGQVLASRAAGVIAMAAPAAMGHQAMPGLLNGPVTGEPAGATADFMGNELGDEGPYAGLSEPWDGGAEAAAPTGQPPIVYHGSAAAPRPAGSGVVIEQIDVFVQEPASREAGRPRLSDPSRRVAARYLGGL